MYKQKPTILSKRKKLFKYVDGLRVRCKKFGVFKGLKELSDYYFFYIAILKKNKLEVELRTKLVIISFFTKIIKFKKDIPYGKVIEHIPPVFTGKVYEKRKIKPDIIPHDKFNMYESMENKGLNIPELFFVTDSKNKVVSGSVDKVEGLINKNSVVEKHRLMHGGAGVRLLNSLDDIRPNCIYQRFVKNHSSIIEMQGNDYCSTVRFAIYNTKEPSVIGAYIRFNSGTIADHSSYGSICANIDPISGLIINNGYNKEGSEFEIHPQTGKKIKDFQIPNWKDCVNAAVLASKKFDELPLLGLDIVPTKHGYIMLEINAGFAVNELQKEKGLLSHQFMKNEFNL